MQVKKKRFEGFSLKHQILLLSRNNCTAHQIHVPGKAFSDLIKPWLIFWERISNSVFGGKTLIIGFSHFVQISSAVLHHPQTSILQLVFLLLSEPKGGWWFLDSKDQGKDLRIGAQQGGGREFNKEFLVILPPCNVSHSLRNSNNKPAQTWLSFAAKIKCHSCVLPIICLCVPSVNSPERAEAHYFLLLASKKKA